MHIAASEDRARETVHDLLSQLVAGVRTVTTNDEARCACAVPFTLGSNDVLAVLSFSRGPPNSFKIMPLCLGDELSCFRR